MDLAEWMENMTLVTEQGVLAAYWDGWLSCLAGERGQDNPHIAPDHKTRTKHILWAQGWAVADGGIIWN